ncbi:JAB domain-containing protein [Pontixanthobacter aquaemixtae]|uniref:DNA repair protein n=1 Tax=Pontixanthobacter aquaemixtae TaxID=1958940 RepID=A0A844ZX75_9SPHN|nr:JAB domain-containing protein [Pontixanthobacter aquaemixtae]MXO91832.1 DNA repair protein [Pontixanthobacter aquaemixtae]
MTFLTYLRERLCRGAKEHLLVIFCDRQGRYLEDAEMGWGTSHSIHLNIAQLFRRALSIDAASMVLAHNHPSGSCHPSEDDIEATRKLVSAGSLLGFEIKDHIIVTQKMAYSMRAGGQL